MPARESHTKLQRWTDLIATLLVHTYPTTFEELAREVPAYESGLDPAHKDSVKRTFERDKDELRDLGVPIESVPVDDGENTGYRLRATRFYMPYLSLAQAERGERAPRPEGYRALPEVSLTADEHAIFGEALQRLDQLGDPLLADHARAAAAKIFMDLPILDVAAPVSIAGTDDGSDPATFELLAEALRRHKSVSFRYSTPDTGAQTERHVDPYGLFFVSAHWYLAAFDRTRDGLRNFRLSRMSDVRVNRKKPQTHDYEIPSSFHLREHSASRSAWELGEAESVTAEVRFTGTTGAVRAAASLGEVVPGRDDVRRFPVRRTEVFARWLLSFGGDAEPLAPGSLVDAYRRAARETLARYTQESA